MKKTLKTRTAKKRVYKKPAVRSMNTKQLTAATNFIGMLGQFVKQALGPNQPAKTIKITKFNERYAIETRDYSCDCGKADCARPKLFITAATADGYPIPSTGMTKATTMEEVEAQHVTGIRAIRDGLAASHLEAHKDLSHALGNCECHGKDGPKA